MSIKTSEFDNGFRIVYEKTSSSIPISSIFVFCNFGSAYEPDDMHGVAHFIEHMLFKGTKSNPTAKKITIEFDRIGASINAFTEKSYTGYMIKCNNTHVDQVIEYISDMLLHSIFEKSGFIKEQNVVIEEAKINASDPQTILFNNMASLLYNGSSYDYPIDHIKYHKSAFDYKKVVDIYSSVYYPGNFTLSIVSSLSFENIRKMCKKSAFVDDSESECKFIRCSRYQIRHEINPQREIQYLLQKQRSAQKIQLAIGFRVHPKDRYLFIFLKKILSGTMSSRLFDILREKNGLTYSSGIIHQYFTHHGDFTLYAETDSSTIIRNGEKKGVLPLIIDMLNELIQHGVYKTEITTIKGYLKGNMNIQLEDGDVSAEHNGMQCLLHPNEAIIPIRKMFDTCYKSITKKQLDTIIREYFKKSNMSVCILGEHLPSETAVHRECEKMVT